MTQDEKSQNARSMDRLVETLGNAVGASEDAETVLLRIARAYRDWALSHPDDYRALWQADIRQLQGETGTLERLLQPLLNVVEEYMSADAPVSKGAAVRGLWAIAHGYVLLEIDRQFRFADAPDAAYEQIIRIYLRGLKGHGSARGR